MKAFILHIHRKYYDKFRGVVTKEDYYSAWCTENQALEEGKKYFISRMKDRSPFGNFTSLNKAITDLFESDKSASAFLLINEFSTMRKSDDSYYATEKFKIKVTESDFRGSPFD